MRPHCVSHKTSNMFYKIGPNKQSAKQKPAKNKHKMLGSQCIPNVIVP